ncbi:MAG TPA: hypothetical protein VFU55_05205 [Terracidiphilus sp.]|nr:hypothetical protein [Terracidiphilus sp.]
MTALGDGTSITGGSGHMQLRALLEVLAPFALAVGVWIWSTMFRSSRRFMRKNRKRARQSESEGTPMVCEMESDPRGAASRQQDLTGA